MQCGTDLNDRAFRTYQTRCESGRVRGLSRRPERATEGLTGHGAIRFVGNLLREGVGPMSRPFSAARLRASPSFLRLSGVSVATFDGMLKQLASPWEKARRPRRHKAKPGRPSDVGGLEDHLPIMLIYYRCYITQEFFGFFYNIHKSAICRRSGGSKSLPGR